MAKLVASSIEWGEQSVLQGSIHLEAAASATMEKPLQLNSLCEVLLVEN